MSGQCCRSEHSDTYTVTEAAEVVRSLTLRVAEQDDTIARLLAILAVDHGLTDAQARTRYLGCTS